MSLFLKIDELGRNGSRLDFGDGSFPILILLSACYDCDLKGSKPFLGLSTI